MSSSLFDSWNDYESYPSTEYVDGIKSFGELKENDVIYCLSFVSADKGFEFEEMKVTKKWHESKGHCYIGCTIGKKKMNINFGPSNCANVFVDSKRNSILWYDNMLIGTNKNVVWETKMNVLKNMYEEVKKEYERKLNLTKLKIELLNNIK